MNLRLLTALLTAACATPLAGCTPGPLAAAVPGVNLAPLSAAPQQRLDGTGHRSHFLVKCPPCTFPQITVQIPMAIWNKLPPLSPSNTNNGNFQFDGKGSTTGYTTTTDPIIVAQVFKNYTGVPSCSAATNGSGYICTFQGTIGGTWHHIHDIYVWLWDANMNVIGHGKLTCPVNPYQNCIDVTNYQRISPTIILHTP